MEAHEVTRLLVRMGGGDTRAAEELHRLVYDELHVRAEGLMRGDRAGNTLQPTAVVHEAWLKLAKSDAIQWEDRSHFLGVACRAMRMVLVDHARARGALKRGGKHERQLLDEALIPYEERAQDLVELDVALERLAAMDPELAQLVELRFFGGLTIDDTARVLGTSNSSVERGWRTARSWLRTQLAEALGGGDDGEAPERS